MAAYEYIKIFCEFLAARMSMIESQKYESHPSELLHYKGINFYYYGRICSNTRYNL